MCSYGIGSIAGRYLALSNGYLELAVVVVGVLACPCGIYLQLAIGHDGGVADGGAVSG